MEAEPSSRPAGSPTVGVIGLGDIGSGVAAGLVRVGVELVVCDIRPESTAPFAETARVASDPAELGSPAAFRRDPAGVGGGRSGAG